MHEMFRGLDRFTDRVIDVLREVERNLNSLTRSIQRRIENVSLLVRVCRYVGLTPG